MAKEWEEVLVVLDEVTVVRLDDRRCSTSCSKETGQMLKRAKEATWAGQGGSGLLEMFDTLQFQYKQHIVIMTKVSEKHHKLTLSTLFQVKHIDPVKMGYVMTK